MTELPRTNRRTVLRTIAATAVGSGVVAGTASGSGEDCGSAASDGANDLEIVATHDHDANEHRFEFSTHDVSAGWTTISLDNRTDHAHFAYLARVPRAAIEAANDEGTELLDFYVEHVTRPFQWFMDDIDPDREPDPDDLSETYSNPEEAVIFPPWFEAVLPSGGTGLTAGETTSTATVDLDPGEYIVECYVKDDAGEFHSYNGMIDILTVADGRSGTEPASTLDVSLSTGGIDVPDDVQAGEHTVAVRVEDQRLYEHLLGHDVHLIRFDDEVTADDVNEWMNWMNPDGLVSDGTEPGTFLGGVQTILTPELLEGGGPETGYFQAALEPGDYAFVSEVPDPRANGLLTEFTVSSG